MHPWVDERVLVEGRVLFAAIEPIASKSELRTRRQDEKTEASSVEHLVLLSFRFRILDFGDGE